VVLDESPAHDGTTDLYGMSGGQLVIRPEIEVVKNLLHVHSLLKVALADEQPKEAAWRSKSSRSHAVRILLCFGLRVWGLNQRPLV